jgi:hypothetical protein
MADSDNPAPTEQEEHTPHAGGRPLKYETAGELESAINKYFALCDPHVEKQMRKVATDLKGNPIFEPIDVLTEQKPYVLSGLARALGIDRRTLLNYSNKEEFFPTIQAAKDRCEEYAEGQLFGPYSNGAKFNLINNYRSDPKKTDWADRHEIDHTSDEKPIPLLAGLVAAGPLVIEDDEDGSAAPADNSPNEDQ